MKGHPGWLALLVLACSSCSRDADDRSRRLAILPPEILIDDASAQWISTALPVVWEEDLATAPHLLVNVVSDASAAYQWGATEVLRTTVENRHRRLRFEGTITETSTQRNREVFELESDSSTGVLPLADAFAKRIDSSATDFSTKNERAFETFTRALQAANLPARMQTLNDAIGMDSGFGLAYLVLAQTAAQSNPQGLAELLANAGKHANSFTALDRARFNSLAAQAAHAPLPQQETALRTLLQLTPNSLDALAGLGSLRFVEGDAANGERLMARALELSPGNVNVRQQLGRGLLENGRFAEAEKVFAGLDSNPAILPALATCILLERDVKRANAVSDRFSRSLQPPLQLVYQAAWLALSGDTAGAISALDGQHFADPNLQSAVVAELVVWRLMQHDFAAAKQTLATQTEPAGAFTAQSILLGDANAPLEEWEGKIKSSSQSAGQKKDVLAYGLFLGGHYAEAAPIWKQMLEQSGGADLRARAMLAGSLDRAGTPQAARKVLIEPFVPEFGDLYAAISFGEMRRLLKL